MTLLMTGKPLCKFHTFVSLIPIAPWHRGSLQFIHVEHCMPIIIRQMSPPDEKRNRKIAKRLYTTNTFVWVRLKCHWSEIKELSNWLQICSSVHKRFILTVSATLKIIFQSFFLARKATFAARQGDMFCRLINMRVTSHDVNRALRVVRIWHVEACGWRYCAAAGPNNVSCIKKTNTPVCSCMFFREMIC